MRKTYVICLTLFMSSNIWAQDPAAVSTTQSFDYNRNSITFLPLQGRINGNANSITKDWASKEDFDGKFDLNVLETDEVNVSGDEYEILNYLNAQQVGMQILNYWLQYDGNVFNTKVLEDRARYNATDADVLMDRAAKVSSLFTKGRDLIKNSYIMVSGPVSMESKTTRDKKTGKTYVTYFAKADSYVYQIDMNDALMQSINENWLLEEDVNSPNEEDRENYRKRKEAYEKLGVYLKYITKIEKKGSGSNEAAAINDAIKATFEPLEKKIDAWQVVTTVFDRHPLAAKIGKKEGLGNSDRYIAFKVVEEDGNVAYKKVGYARATKVNDNRAVATGESGVSNFYQISGRNIDEGYYLKQKKDSRLGVSFGAFPNKYSMGEVGIEYLMHTSQGLGAMTYAMLSVGYDSFKDLDATYIPISLGLGLGLHPHRVLEIMPYVAVGVDFYNDKDSANDDDETTSKKMAYIAHGGVRVGLQIFYPVQIYGKIAYNHILHEGELYVRPAEYDNGISIGGGLKISF